MTTPMRKQYLEIKKRYPDAIVLFRLGDFYETFDEDATVVSQVCDIVLTSRPVTKGQRVPMAGVPHHAVDGYIAKLINAGHKVAIAEQVGGEPAKGLMAREVTRVITPGTVVEPELLEEKRNNYLASLVIEGDRAGLAYVDITTGEFATTQLDEGDVLHLARQELARLQPAECLMPENTLRIPGFDQESVTHFTPYDEWRFELGNARRALLDHFGVATLDGYGCEGVPLAVCAAGAIVQYLSETQKAALEQLDSLATYSTKGFMVLDPATRRNLELTQTIRGRKTQGSVLGVLDATVTAMGGRLLHRWLNQPLLDVEALNQRLDVVGALHQDGPLRMQLTSLLKGLRDLERLSNRVVQGVVGPREFLALKEGLEVVPRTKEVLEGTEEDESVLAELAAQLDPCEEVTELIDQAIADDAPANLGNGGVIASGFSAELDSFTTSAREAKEWVAGLERRERERTGIKSLKVGYNKVFGYYLEATKPNLDRVPEEYIRKQTLVNSERFITPQLKEYEALILNAQERSVELEATIFRQVCQQVAEASPRILATARALAHLDVFSALAEVAARNNYVRPVLSEGDDIEITAGRHPVVELTQREEPFVPNDLYLVPREGQLIVLTGPNMSGKSTYLRQVALIVLMAQIGSFVPADEARIGMVDRIFTRIGAQDEISAGQSTFMVEMVETAGILHHASDKSLLILDEIGRGTSTYDGISIAWAVVEYIHNHPRLRAKTLFATHYHELTELAGVLPRVRNYSVAVAEEGDKVVFLHRIVPGGADRSYGIHVAQLAGLPRVVIQRAEEILEELEKGASRSPGAVPSEGTTEQLSLFSMRPHPLLERVKNLDLTTMTPLEALNKLYEWQQELRGSE
ncbi:MAG: DNA mismatch repair protein MutS [Chloroflexi bacterium B3_Chlor]|nr:MAG: DNA mismatch repair protein MutS [Chloroflexi bacterium B3_Chlor]